ncbi:TPA: hypothetical protein ACJJYX_004305 [Enterobacter cloacae]|jgi:hypothetical protein
MIPINDHERQGFKDYLVSIDGKEFLCRKIGVESYVAVSELSAFLDLPIEIEDWRLKRNPAEIKMPEVHELPFYLKKKPFFNSKDAERTIKFIKSEDLPLYAESVVQAWPHYYSNHSSKLLTITILLRAKLLNLDP